MLLGELRVDSRGADLPKVQTRVSMGVEPGVSGDQSMRDYYDNRWHGTPIGPDDFVATPTAMAVFANEFVPEGQPPRSWYERLYNIQRWTVCPRGGHFAAAEEPDLLASDIAEFFADLR